MKSEEQKTMREEQRMMGEEQSVMSVTDYTPFEEEEEEEVSPFAPFLLDEDDWSCSADNQLPKETPLSTIHYSLSLFTIHCSLFTVHFTNGYRLHFMLVSLVQSLKDGEHLCLARGETFLLVTFLYKGHCPFQFGIRSP